MAIASKYMYSQGTNDSTIGIAQAWMGQDGSKWMPVLMLQQSTRLG